MVNSPSLCKQSSLPAVNPGTLTQSWLIARHYSTRLAPKIGNKEIATLSLEMVLKLEKGERHFQPLSN